MAMSTSNYSASIPISIESLEMWEADDCGFVEYIKSEMAKVLQEFLEEEDERIENEILNGTGNEEPTGVLHAS